MSLTLEQTRAGYLNLWNDMAILSERRTDLKEAVETIAKGRARYEAVEKRTGGARQST
jgi:lysozyme family protein